VVYQLPVKL